MHAPHSPSAGPTRVIVINGAPGVGKTETARRLIARCPERAALIDTDALVGIHPWHIDDAFYALVGANLRTCLANYRAWGARVVVISGVFIPEGIYAQVRPLLEAEEYTWSFYALQARPDTLRARILADPKPQDPALRLDCLPLNDEVRDIPGTVLVDTDGRSVEAVVAELARLAGFPLPAPPPGPRRGARVVVPVAEVEALARAALRRMGAPADAARDVAAALLDAEMAGYGSHGLLRIPEYADAAAAGTLRPRSRPRVRVTAGGARLVDGRRGFGVLAGACLRDALREGAAEHTVAVAGLVNSHHLGRLAPIAAPLASEGMVVLGFANYLGAGQKVAPWGGRAPRLSTNPIVIALPGAAGPLVADLTTSAVAEGKVREAALAGTPAPEGWLLDSDGRWVTDPERLYREPERVFLAPLGGAVGYKGTALAVAAEVLAGVATGAGFVGPRPGGGGNGGFFLAFPLGVFGRAADVLRAELEQLEEYLQSAPPAEGTGPVRLPGRGAEALAARVRAAGEMEVSAVTLERLRALAAGTPPPETGFPSP
jgi:LDH2 family malate/lactate/ureidoglycolate dehydrogenase